MKKLFIKILPFLVAFISGILLYIITDLFISNTGLNNLLINISSGLVSIPLVFIFYDVINKITSRNLHNSLFESVTIEINNQLIELISYLCTTLNLKQPETLRELDDFLELEQNEIYQKLPIPPIKTETLKNIKEQLLEIIHKPSTFEILTESQISSILNITKEITFLAKNLSYKTNKKTLHKHNRIIALNIEYIIDNLTTWIESGKKDAFHNHARFSLSENKKN